MDPRRWPELATPSQRELFRKWRNNLSDLLLIQKEGCDLYKAALFFQNELDADIPYAKMGFLNLFEFFFHCQDILQLRASHNKYFLFIREDACPADQRHLRQLAKGQANSKTRAGIGRGIKIRPTIHNTHPISIHNLLRMNSNQLFLNRVPPADLRSQNKPGSSRSRRYSSNQRGSQTTNRGGSQSQNRYQNQSSHPTKAQTQPSRPHFKPHTFAPGPPVRVRSRSPQPSNSTFKQNSSNFARPSSYISSDSDDLDIKPSSTRPKYGYGENASTIPVRPVDAFNFKSENPSSTAAPPPSQPLPLPLSNIGNNNKFQERYKNAINYEEKPVASKIAASTSAATTRSPQKPKEVVTLKKLDDKEVLVENGKNVSNHKSSFDDYETSDSDEYEYEWVEKGSSSNQKYGYGEKVSISTSPVPSYKNENPKNTFDVPSPSSPVSQIRLRPLMSIDTVDYRNPQVGRSQIFASALSSMVNQGASHKPATPGPFSSIPPQKPKETSNLKDKNISTASQNKSLPSVSLPLPTQPSLPSKAGNANPTVPIPPLMTPFINLTRTIDNKSSQAANGNANPSVPPPVMKSFVNLTRTVYNSNSQVGRPPLCNAQVINSEAIQTSSRPAPSSISNLKISDENKENLIEKDKNISTLCQNKASSNELSSSTSLVKKPESDDHDSEKKKKEKQKLVNVMRLQNQVDRIFVTNVTHGNEKVRTKCQPIPHFITHELAVVYVPFLKRLECVYANDILIEC